MNSFEYCQQKYDDMLPEEPKVFKCPSLCLNYKEDICEISKETIENCSKIDLDYEYSTCLDCKEFEF